MQNEALAKHFVSCTKEDTMMNTWVARARLEWVLLTCSFSTPEFHAHCLLYCTQLILTVCRKWRPPETDEEKQLKKQRAQDSKKRKKEEKEGRVKEE